LSGLAQFYSDINGIQHLFPPDPIDIGHVAVGGSFSTSFIPGDPCLGDGSCRLDFAFGVGTSPDAIDPTKVQLTIA
jgi:hypothetical protein